MFSHLKALTIHNVCILHRSIKLLLAAHKLINYSTTEMRLLANLSLWAVKTPELDEQGY